MRFIRQMMGVLALGLAACSPSLDKTTSANIAVATNFYSTAQKLEADFEAKTDLDIALSSGSSGQLYAQIINGAPFDIFLSADQERPSALIENGFAEDETRFTYAVGALALWSRDMERVSVETLETPFRKLAIANPDLAPYGRASMQVIEALGLTANLNDNIVKGENVGQTYSLISTGNAELGIIAFSQVRAEQKDVIWKVPTELHSPIYQDAVLLTSASENSAAKAFYAYLQSPEAMDIITSDGYGGVHAN